MPDCNHIIDRKRREHTLQRLREQRDIVLEVRSLQDTRIGPVGIADIETGAGTSAMIWAENGDHAVGVDIDEALIEWAGKRAGDLGLKILFEVACADNIPVPDHAVNWFTPYGLRSALRRRGCTTFYEGIEKNPALPHTA